MRGEMDDAMSGRLLLEGLLGGLLLGQVNGSRISGSGRSRLVPQADQPLGFLQGGRKRFEGDRAEVTCGDAAARVRARSIYRFAARGGEEALEVGSTDCEQPGTRLDSGAGCDQVPFRRQVVEQGSGLDEVAVAFGR